MALMPEIAGLTREDKPVKDTKVKSYREENKMADGINTDKVIVNAGGSGEGAGAMAALVAALGNRNQGNDSAALIAALGNRNDDSSQWAPLMAMMGRRDGDDGMNNLWPILLLALLGRGRGGGLFGGGDAINQITLNQVLSKLGTLEGQVPLVGSQVENSILEQTNALTNILNQNNIAQLVAQSNTKDAVTNTGAVLLNAGNQNTQAILQAVDAPFRTSSWFGKRKISHRCYIVWYNILQRCYSEYAPTNNPTYKDVTVCDEWLTFSNFYKWWKSNKVDGWHIDKDLLVAGNKIYSPDTCIYIPRELNNFANASEATRGLSKLIGANFHKRDSKFEGHVSDGSGKKIYLGRFDDAISAHNAWYSKKLELAQDYKELCDSIHPDIFNGLISKIKSQYLT